MGYKRRRENRSLPCSASLNAAHGRKGALWPIPVDVSSYQWLQQSPHGTLATHGCMTGSIRLPSRRLMTYTTMFEPFARIYFFLPSPRIKRRVSSLLSPPNSWSSWLQIFLLGILYLSIPTYAGGLYSIGTDSMTGSTSAPSNLGKTEGCFSKFDFLLSQTYPAVEIDNRVCQAFCASQRFSVSATSLNTCYCGNNYPSAFFKVKDDICDNPCSPDKTYCFVYACCGSRDGTYFTVAFAGQLDPVLQLLRQLTYDYRMSNPRLRDHIKTLMGASAPLQVMSSSGLSTGVVMSGGAGIGLQGSCPDHYSEFKGACYSRVYGKMMSYIQAKERCQEDGASLAVITSREENDYLTRMLFQRPGWIGLSNRDVGGFQWDDYTNWGPGEPNSLNGFVTKLPVSGAATGDAFDDLQAGVRNIRQLAVYSSSRLLGIQGRYLYTNGSEIIGNVMGTNKGGDTAVISLSYGQYFASAFGDVVNDKLQSLNLVVKDVKGNSITYGPYGTPGGSGAKSWIVNATGLLVGFFGFNSPQGINQLGFYDLQSPRCTQVTPQGKWRTIPCAQSFDGVSYACQLRPTASAVDCPAGGWFRYGGFCYKAFSGNKLSWESARLSCLTMQATLVTVATPEMSEFFQSRFRGSYGFVGLKDRMPMGQTNRSFVWESYTNWGVGEPRPLPQPSTSASPGARVNTGGGCLAMDVSQTWFTIDCGDTSVPRAIVCELTPTDNYCTCPDGWTAFSCRCYRVVSRTSSNAFAGGVSWITAAQACEGLGGALLDVNSPGESSYIASRLAKNQAVFLGRRDVFNSGIFTSNTFSNWALGEPIDNLGTVNGGGSGLCGVLRGDSQWYGFPCTSSFSQAVCKRPKASPVGGRITTGEEFTMLAVDQDVEPRWGTPLDVYLQHSATGAYLGIDGAGNVFTSTSRSNDVQLQVVGAVNTTGFTIKSKNYGFYLKLDPDEGHLKTLDNSVIDADDFSYYRREHQRRVPMVAAENRRERNDAGAEDLRADESFVRSDSLSPENSEDDSNEEGIFARKRRARNRRHQALDRSRREVLTFNAGTATPAPTPAGMKFDSNEANKPSVFSSTKSFGPVSVQNLQIGVTVQKSESMPNPRYCSLKIYDLTATSDSFSCYYIQGDTSNLPMVDLSVQAFTIQDKTTNMKPRTPLQNGRTKCENESPTDTLTCTFSYGEGLTFSTALSVTWGQNYANQFQMERRYGENTAIWYNYLYAYDNQYTSITTNTYVESRNWAVNVPVPPLTVCTIQYWLTSVDVNYVWLAILKATGSFELSANGVYFGTNHALSDVSDPWDLNVYQWGRYSATSQAEVIITTDEMQAAKYQLQVPPMNNIP